MKKLLPLLIVWILVFSGFGISAFTFEKNMNNIYSEKNCENNNFKNRDELDQYQLERDGFGYIGREPDNPYDYYIVAQKFKPAKDVLTRVELMVKKDVTTTYNLTVTIKESITGTELTSISKSPDSIPSEDFSWIEFDFDDINITMGNSYYIICSTINAVDNRYAWGAKTGDVYPNGSIYWSKDGEKWYTDSGIDAAFKTYGIENNPPLLPVIDGPTTGTYGNTYEWTFVSTDPEGDDIYYYICWGGTCVGQWYGPYASGEVVTKGYTYQFQGTYTIICKPKDVYGAEGPLAELIVTMPREKTINTPFLNLLQNYPVIFEIVKRIFL
ncbi:hypothetical protein AYK20_02460 [Thermoplasmatales archaeon SG8-52-1]|nr:MAG: hypothetical protein AYK20_02460 [Thermoplasmatales archaeon SG8-52-1]